MAIAQRSSHRLPVRLELPPRLLAATQLDGAWWPHTNCFTDELPALIRAITPRWGRIRVVLLNPADWNNAPAAWNAPGHPPTWVSWPEESQRHLATLIRHDGQRLALLLIPVNTHGTVAHAAMAAARDAATRVGTTPNTVTAAKILLAAQREAALNSRGRCDSG
jgi:uncharacterized protein DUF5994